MQRDDKGRYLKGASGNPGGRPKHSKDYQEAIKAACTPAKWRKIINQAITDATQGDRWARQWLSDYVLGKPTNYVHVEGAVGFSLADWLVREAERLEDIE